MPTAIEIKNPLNNAVLRCKPLGEKSISLGLINGRNMRGIAVPIESLGKSPVHDLFVKDALNNGFTQEHINKVEALALLDSLYDTFNRIANDDSHEDFGLKEDYFN